MRLISQFWKKMEGETKFLKDFLVTLANNKIKY